MKKILKYFCCSLISVLSLLILLSCSGKTNDTNTKAESTETDTGNEQQANPCDLGEHSWITISKVDATCTQDGKKVYECSRCGRTKEEKITRTGHSMPSEGIVIEPTCNKGGYTLFECQNGCGFSMKKDQTSATGNHNLGTYRMTVSPTAFSSGIETRYCKVCSMPEARTVAPLTDLNELNINNYVYTGGDYNNQPFVNISPLGGAEASDYSRTSYAGNAIDGLTNTYWQADTCVDGAVYTGHSLMIRFEKEYDIGMVKMVIPNYYSWQLGEDCYVSFDIEALINNEWTKIGEISDKTINDMSSLNAIGILELSEPVKASKVRAVVTHSNRHTPAMIYEMEVYAYVEGITRVGVNIASLASVSISGKYNDYGGTATNLTDGKSDGWMTDARYKMYGDYKETHFITEFTDTDGNSVLRKLNSISLKLDKYVGEAIRVLYQGDNGIGGLDWIPLTFAGSESNGWYAITDDSEDEIPVNIDLSDRIIITGKIKVEAKGYKPRTDLDSTVETVAPTLTELGIEYFDVTITKEISLTKDVTQDDGTVKQEKKSEYELFTERLANKSVDETKKSETLTEFSWKDKGSVYAQLMFPSEQYLAYLTWETTIIKDRIFSLQLFVKDEGYPDGHFIEFGRYTVGDNDDYADENGLHTVQKDGKFTVDIDRKVYGIKLQILVEQQYWESKINEITPYTIKETSVGEIAFSGCLHKLLNNRDFEKIAPTCENAGYTKYKCRGCDEYIHITDSVDALGHQYGEYSVTKEATATENGVMTAVCSICEGTKTKTVPALVYGELQPAEITKYFRNAPAAWSMTFDDGNYLSTYDWVIPRLQEYGFRATVVMTIGFSDSLISKWNQYFETGVFDLGSHSYTHAAVFSSSSGEDPLLYEVNSAQFVMMNWFPGQRMLGFATPGGSTSEFAASVITDMLSAGRNGNGGLKFNDPDKLTTRKQWGNLDSYNSKSTETEGKYEFIKKDEVETNYIYDSTTNKLENKTDYIGTYFYDEENYRYEFRENCSYKLEGENYVFAEDNSGDYILAHTEKGSYEKAIDILVEGGLWSVECLHELGSGSIYSSYDSTISKFEYLKETGVWVGSYTQVIQYERERLNATVNVTSVGENKIKLELSDTLEDFLFNHALTVKVDIPEDWKSITVTQDGKDISFFIEDGFAYVDAVPNCGEIVITDISD